MAATMDRWLSTKVPSQSKTASRKPRARYRFREADEGEGWPAAVAMSFRALAEAVMVSLARQRFTSTLAATCWM